MSDRCAYATSVDRLTVAALQEHIPRALTEDLIHRILDVIFFTVHIPILNVCQNPVSLHSNTAIRLECQVTAQVCGPVACHQRLRQAC